MGESLNPTLLNRISRAVRPDFARTLAARRIAAGVLVVLAAVVALRPDPGHTLREVVVAARDLSPGVTLRADDVAVAKRPAAWIPDGAANAVIRTGDVVDVLGAPAADTDAHPRVVANNAVVVLVSPESTALGATNDRVVLVALPAAAATALAGATLVQSVTLTIH